MAKKRSKAEGEERFNYEAEGGIVEFPDGRKFRMYESGLVPVADDEVDTPASRQRPPKRKET